MARAVGNPGLARLAKAAAALKQCILN